MRVTISHNKAKQSAKEQVDRSLEQFFEGIGRGALEFTDQQKQWSGDTMNFSLTASMGFLRTPIRGFVLVADHDLTIDVDLGLLANVIPESAVRSKIEARIRGLIGS